MAAVDTKHPEYLLMQDGWTDNEILTAGARVVKANFNRLVVHPFTQPTQEHKEKADKIKRLSVFTEYPTRTVTALRSMAFAKSPVIELPVALEYLLDNSDGQGNSLEQAMKRTLQNQVIYGRHGLYVDYPAVDESLTVAQIKSLGLQAYIYQYNPKSIINWRADGDDLTLVVMVETYTKEDDGFSETLGEQYRVLRLIEGVYTVEVYREGSLYEQRQPRDASGRLMSFIPFVFVGAMNNDAGCDKPPIDPICELSRSHFQNAVDLELRLYVGGSPTLHVSLGQGESQQTFDEANTSGIKVGAFNTIVTQAGGKVEFVEVAQNSALQERMNTKRDEMIALGAKMITDQQTAITATQARIVNQSESATLSDMVNNLADAYAKAIAYCELFMTGTMSDITIEFDKQYYLGLAEPQALALMVQFLDRGIVARRDVFDLLKRNNLIEESREFEDVANEADSVI